MQPAPTNGVTAILGPTNTGKTHHAVERMLAAPTAMIGLPLRLLAREVYDRIKEAKGPAQVALITGEEKIVPPRPCYYVCTVEAMPTEISVDCLVLDEVQLCADMDRGHVFTNRLLYSRGRKETLFLGAATAKPLLERLLGKIVTEPRERFSNLTYAGPKKVSRLPRRTAIVAFSTEAVYAIAELIRRQRGGAAVVMGALSPRSRNAQAELYQSGDVDFLVATDAIGMGLNMDVSHVAFAGLSKFDGRQPRRLTPAEIGQIAGRAGRHIKDGTFGVTADCPPLHEEAVQAVEDHRFEPLRFAFWRNRGLDFESLSGLMRSLDERPRHDALRRAPPQADLDALKRFAADGEVRERIKGRMMTRLLWDVCQIPDFRKTSPEEHFRLLAQLFDHLAGPHGLIPEDWIAGMLDRLDRLDGDVDALSTRIAHVRTWTFVAHRHGWLKDPAHWRARSRLLEDKLSDALHERLTQRFVDRRTSALIRGLRDRKNLAAAVTAAGEVKVEGHRVGEIDGLNVNIDAGEGAEARAVGAAARKALAPEIKRRAGDLIRDRDDFFQLKQNGDILWRGGPAGKLVGLDEAGKPRVRLADEDFIDGHLREEATKRLQSFVEESLKAKLAPLHAVRALVDAPDSPLSPGARGFAFQWLEAGGALERAAHAETVDALNENDRKALRASGVRIGRWTVHAPGLLGPEAVRLNLVTHAMKAGGEPPEPPTPGLTSFSLDGEAAPDMRTGFRAVGPRAVRLDILERLDGLIRKRMRESSGKGFVPDADMMAILGCGREDLEGVLRALGFAPRPPRRKPATAPTPDAESEGQNAAAGAAPVRSGPPTSAETVETAPPAAGSSPAEDGPTAQAGPTTTIETTSETVAETQPAAVSEPAGPAVSGVPGEADASSTHEPEPASSEAEEPILWGPASRRRPQRGGSRRRQDKEHEQNQRRGPRSHNARKGEAAGGEKRGPRPPKRDGDRQRRQQKENGPRVMSAGPKPRQDQKVDPDNPFAALAALKFGDDAKTGEDA